MNNIAFFEEYKPEILNICKEAVNDSYSILDISEKIETYLEDWISTTFDDCGDILISIIDAGDGELDVEVRLIDTDRVYKYYYNFGISLSYKAESIFDFTGFGKEKL